LKSQKKTKRKEDENEDVFKTKSKIEKMIRENQNGRKWRGRREGFWSSRRLD